MWYNIDNMVAIPTKEVDMKKRLTKILFAVCSVAILCVMLAGCASTNVKDITKYADKLAEAKSFTMVGSVTVGEGKSAKTEEIIMKFTEDKMYTKTPAIAGLTGGEVYTEIKDGKLYTYTKNEETWIKSEGISITVDEKNDIDESKDSIKAMLNADYFEYSKDKKAFVLKAGSSLPEDFKGTEDFTMTLKAGELKMSLVLPINMVITTIKATITMSIKNINSTSISLPKVG